MSSINRKPHVIKREKTITFPRYFIFFDTETSQNVLHNGETKQIFKLGWAVYYRRPYGRHREKIEWFFIDNISAFWRFVFQHTEPKQRLWVIARNVCFDFTVCRGWEYLRKEGYKLKFFHNKGTSAIISVTKGNRSLVFLDSMNWFPESLAQTGERLGIHKKKIDFNTCTIQELSDYCRNDVLIEFEHFRSFIKFLEGNAISGVRYTRASTAMSAYLFRHYHTPIYIHNNAQAIKLERDTYKGGRCECFYIGDLNDETHYILDVNSLYPYVMAVNKYPVKYARLLHNVGLADFSRYLSDFSCVAKVRLYTHEPVYAVKRDRTIFPIGRFDATLSTPELKYALEHGHIEKVYDCVTYEQANIFSSFVSTIYQYRQEFKSAGVKVYEQLCKYLMNSLYGKWGQKAENWIKVGEAPNEPDREELIFHNNPRIVTRLRFLLGQVFELKGYGESFNSFPAISAHVTAYGRLHLWSLMQIAGEGNYFYCDTDSLMVNGVGKCNLVKQMNDTELGKLKVQEKLTTLTIRGLKDYQTDTKNVIKGVRKKALQLSSSIYQQESWPTFKGLLKKGNVNEYVVTEVTKHLTRHYTKGTVTESGVVEPFVLT